MIARTWFARTTPEKADKYQHHFTATVVPNLKAIAGNRGAYLLRRVVDGEVEFAAVTLWDSIDTIRMFAGGNADAAHVEPEGRAALTRFDAFAGNFEIVCNTVSGG